MKSESQMKVIYKIKELRENENTSQSLLSEILNLNSNGSIGNIESPKFAHKYTLEQLYVLAKHFQFPFEFLFLSKEEFEKPKGEVIETLINRIIEYGK